MTDFNFVTQRVATGARVVDEAFVNALVAAGITHVIDTTDAQDDAPLLASHPQMAYLWNPTADDGTKKDSAWFEKSLNFALPAFAIPHATIYAHCSAGINRGPSTAFAIMIALGWEPATALAQIKARRPEAEVRYAADAEAAIIALGY